MRLYNVLFISVLLVVSVFAFANANTMTNSTTIIVPFVGTRVVQLRLIGTLAFVGLAALYSTLWYFSSTRQRAKSADYLTKLEETRRTLDEKEASRFAQLQAQLEAATNDILARVGGQPSAPKGGLLSRLTGTPAPSASPLPGSAATLETLVGRIEKVRDELAADIASSEHEILEAIQTLKDRK
jgi:hypothetical protein